MTMDDLMQRARRNADGDWQVLVYVKPPERHDINGAFPAVVTMATRWCRSQTLDGLAVEVAVATGVALEGDINGGAA
jgi:hypothetical protein